MPLRGVVGGVENVAAAGGIGSRGIDCRHERDPRFHDRQARARTLPERRRWARRARLGDARGHHDHAHGERRNNARGVPRWAGMTDSDALDAYSAVVVRYTR